MFKFAMKTMVAAVALAGAVSGAHAYALLDGAGNSLINGRTDMTGFDWDSNGTAVVQGWDATKDGSQAVTLVYFATATALKDSAGKNILGTGLETSFEFTIVLQIASTVTCTNYVGGLCTSNSFQSLSGANTGTFAIYYDTAVNANMATGTGLDDGTKILTGNVTDYVGSFTVLGDRGFGFTTLDGTFNWGDTSYISPIPTGTNANAMLDMGDRLTDWTTPAGLPNGGGTATPLGNGDIAFQADGNQTLRGGTVPEPTSLALVGVALAGLGVLRRRKAAK